MDPQAGDDIVGAALKVLLTEDPHVKAARTEAIVQLWEQGAITLPPRGRTYAVPERPARDGQVRLVPAKEAPRRGKGGTLASRQAMLHALANIENWAVDLAWDIIARFGAADAAGAGYQLPRDFYTDFVAVAADECRHFRLLEQRLQASGSHYGALTAHEGLWESASATAGNLAARLAVEHATHEARGLDVLPQTIHRFRSNGDVASADLLQDVIYPEEIGHVAAGVRWLRHLHRVAHEHDWQQHDQGQAQQGPQPQQHLNEQPPVGQQEAGERAAQREQQAEEQQQAGEQQEEEQQQAGEQQEEEQRGIPEWAAEARQHASVESWFHALVRRYFRGPLKPPFNEEARAKAGFGPEWYLPLAADD